MARKKTAKKTPKAVDEPNEVIEEKPQLPPTPPKRVETPIPKPVAPRRKTVDVAAVHAAVESRITVRSIQGVRQATDAALKAMGITMQEYLDAKRARR